MSYPAPILNLNFANAKQLVHPAVAFSRASQGSYFDSNGVLRYASAGAPRFDYDPMGYECRGLLVEPAVTFLDTYSEQFDNDAWTKSHASVLPNASISPDGFFTMDKLYEDTTSDNVHNIQRDFSGLTVGSSYTFKLSAKASERAWLNITIGNNGVFPSTYFNLSTGEKGTTSGSLTTQIISTGIDTYDCYVSFVAEATTIVVFIFMAIGDNGQTYTGDGSSGIYIWGAKIYAGSGPTSYLPTTTAGVTRAADVCSVDLTQLKDAGGNALWSGAEGTVVINGAIPLSISSSSNIICSLDDGTSSNRCYVQLDTTGVVYAKIISNGVQTCTLTLGTPQLGEDFSLIVALKDDNNASVYNGSLATQSNLGEIPLGTTIFHIGCNAYGGVQLNSAIKAVKLYNRRIPDEYLPILSTL